MQAAEQGFQLIAIGALAPSPLNTRRHMDEKALEELAASIQIHGVLTPLLVRTNGNGKFEIAAGERRFRAAKKAGVAELPAVVRTMDDIQFLEVVTIENLQREDVHPLDEGLGYAGLMKKANYTVEQVADKVGKSTSYIYQRLKLAELIPPAQKLFLEDKITASHAILIARLQPKDQERVLRSALFEKEWIARGHEHTLRSGDASGEVLRTRSVRELELWIQSNLLLNLAKAPWKKDDAGLYPEAGPCTTCPKRAANQPQLFSDVGKGDVCTDGHCFGRKFSLYINQRLKDVEAKTGKPALKLSREWGRSGKDVVRLNTYDSDTKEVRKDSCKSARAGVFVNGRAAGQVAHVCLDKGCKVHRSPAQRETPEYLEKQKQYRKREQLEELVRFRLVHSILDRFDGNLTPRILQIVLLNWLSYSDTDVDLLAQRFAIRGRAHFPTDGNVQKRILEMKGGELERALLTLAISNFISDNWIRPADQKRLHELAGLVGIDPKKIEAEEKARAKEREKLNLKAGTCRVCSCTERTPCNPPCSWTDPSETLCDNPKCLSAAAKLQTSAKGQKK